MTAQLVQFRPAQIALAQIEDMCEAAAINSFKLVVKRRIKLGTGDRDNIARYSARLRVLYDASYSLDAAIIVVNRWYNAERSIADLMATIPYASQPDGLSLDILRELRLMLRLLRTSEYAEHYKAIMDLVIKGYCTEL